MFSIELKCRRCGWRTICGGEEATARLRLIGPLRREKNPEEAFLAELLADAAPRMTCPACKHKGTLRAMPASEEQAHEEKWDDQDWQAAVLCELCRQPIPPERVAALPGVMRCVECQGKSESGVLEQDAPEFCPKCGSLVELRVSRGTGITRYKKFCTNSPPCRI